MKTPGKTGGFVFWGPGFCRPDPRRSQGFSGFHGTGGDRLIQCWIRLAGFPSGRYTGRKSSSFGDRGGAGSAACSTTAGGGSTRALAICSSVGQCHQSRPMTNHTSTPTARGNISTSKMRTRRKTVTACPRRHRAADRARSCRPRRARRPNAATPRPNSRCGNNRGSDWPRRVSPGKNPRA